MSTVSKTIKALLLARELSQNDLAKHLKKSKSAVSHMLNKASIPQETLQQVAEFLNVDVDTLTNGTILVPGQSDMSNKPDTVLYERMINTQIEVIKVKDELIEQFKEEKRSLSELLLQCKESEKSLLELLNKNKPSQS